MTSEYTFIPKNQKLTGETTIVEFGGDVLTSSVTVEIVEFKGWGGVIPGSRAVKEFTTIYGESICNQWVFLTQVNPNRYVANTYPGSSGGNWVYKGDTSIKVKVSWTPYSAPPDPPTVDQKYEPGQEGYAENNPPLELLDELTPVYGEEYIVETRLLEEGFNLHCCDFYDIETLGIGKKPAEENLISNLIPNRTIALRLAALQIFETGKKYTEFSLSIPPNLYIREGSTVKMTYSPRQLNAQTFITRRAISIASDSQSYIIEGAIVDRSK